MKFVTRFDGIKKSQVKFSLTDKITKDSFKDECDINNIVRKYKATGQLPSLVRQDARYGDFSDVPTYMEALERVRLAEEAFSALPAEVRKDCDNDPAVFLEKVRDKAWAEKHKLALPPSSATTSVVEETGQVSDKKAGGKEAPQNGKSD